MTEPFENKKSALSAESSKEAYLFNEILGGGVGLMARALAFHQCG